MTLIHKSDVLQTMQTTETATGVLATQGHVTPVQALRIIVSQATAKEALLLAFGDRDTIALDEVHFGEETDIDIRHALVILLANVAVASAVRMEQARSIGEPKMDVLARFPIMERCEEVRTQLLRQFGLYTTPPSDPGLHQN